MGNITVGGTGKTPHVEYLVKLLNKKFKVSVLSRGYKRKTKGLVIADENPKSKDIGDEPVQIKLKYPKVDIVVDSNRVRGIETLLQRKNKVVILDDAYQHRYVKPGLSILLIDYNRQIYKDHLLPFGNLREPQKARYRADIILFTKTPKSIKPIDKRIAMEHLQALPYQRVYFSSFSYGNLTNVFGNHIRVCDDFINAPELYTILLVTGIANTRSLVSYLKNFSRNIKHIKFADHVNYNNNKINNIIDTFSKIKNDKKIIITTEKDAVKLREQSDINNLLLNNTFYLPIEVKILDKQSEFNNQILDYVKKNTRNS